MLGLFVLGILVLWLWFAIWAGGAISNRIFKRDSQQPSQDAAQNHRIIRFITQVLMTLFVLLLPFMDQLIAYPKWQQLCATTGDFEWGPGMDEKKAFGRELIASGTNHETTIFPNIHVTYFSTQFKDIETGELVLNMPHYSYYKAEGFFYIPSSSGDKNAIFLHECTTHGNDKYVVDYLNKFKLIVPGYNIKG